VVAVVLVGAIMVLRGNLAENPRCGALRSGLATQQGVMNSAFGEMDAVGTANPSAYNDQVDVYNAAVDEANAMIAEAKPLECSQIRTDPYQPLTHLIESPF
jgi:hypothetical protein